MRFSLKTLQLFAAIVEQRSITRAARASHIALAAASRRLTEFEQEAGTRLVNRNRTGVELTAAGRSALFHVQRVLQELEELRIQLLDYSKGVKGVVHIHVNTSALLQYVPKDLGTFSELYPDIKILLREGWSSDIVQAVRDGSADVGIVMEGADTLGLTAYEYRTDHLAVVALRSMTLPRKIMWSQLLELDLVTLESSASMLRLLSDKAMQEKRPLRLRAQVKSFEAVLRMVQAGLGVGILPQGAVQEMVKGMNLKLVPIDDAWAERKMYICVRDPRQISMVAWQLVEHLTAGKQMKPATDASST